MCGYVCTRREQIIPILYASQCLQNHVEATTRSALIKGKRNAICKKKPYKKQ